MSATLRDCASVPCESTLDLIFQHQSALRNLLRKHDYDMSEKMRTEKLEAQARSYNFPSARNAAYGWDDFAPCIADDFFSPVTRIRESGFTPSFSSWTDPTFFRPKLTSYPDDAQSSDYYTVAEASSFFRAGGGWDEAWPVYPTDIAPVEYSTQTDLQIPQAKVGGHSSMGRSVHPWPLKIIGEDTLSKSLTVTVIEDEVQAEIWIPSSYFTPSRPKSPDSRRDSGYAEADDDDDNESGIIWFQCGVDGNESNEGSSATDGDQCDLGGKKPSDNGSSLGDSASFVLANFEEEETDLTGVVACSQPIEGVDSSIVNIDKGVAPNKKKTKLRRCLAFFRRRLLTCWKDTGVD